MHPIQRVVIYRVDLTLRRWVLLDLIILSSCASQISFDKAIIFECVRLSQFCWIYPYRKLLFVCALSNYEYNFVKTNPYSRKLSSLLQIFFFTLMKQCCKDSQSFLIFTLANSLQTGINSACVFFCTKFSFVIHIYNPYIFCGTNVREILIMCFSSLPKEVPASIDSSLVHIIMLLSLICIFYFNLIILIRYSLQNWLITSA